jgi:two-component system sensor histidine kinase KdpD
VGDENGQAELDRVRRRLERERQIRIEAEAIAERATARLYEADRLKSAFLGTVSHELRTPLTAIVGFGDVLCRQWDALDDAKRLDFVERVQRNATVLQTLIDDLLDFTRLDRDHFSLTLCNLSLSALVPKVVDQLAVELARHHVDVEVEDDVWTLADEVAVTRVLTNLLTNAARFAPEHSTIQVMVASREGQAVLTIEDEGPGIPVDERALVFERFYRGRNAATAQVHGTGIGLAVVKELTERMHGSVTVGEGRLGGACFLVFLPLSAPIGT